MILNYLRDWIEDTCSIVGTHIRVVSPTNGPTFVLVDDGSAKNLYIYIYTHLDP